MRDDEDERDEKEFTELQQAAGNLLAAPPPSRRRGRSRARAAGKVNLKKETFVKVPLWWIERAAHATRAPQAFVCVWLLHLAWKTKSTTFPLPNGLLEARGVERHTKYRALAALEAAGMITVDRRDRKTPIINIVAL
jgi:hypothetical protein